MGGLNFAPPLSYGSGGTGASSVAVGDVNGDGKPDLLVANRCAGVNCPFGPGNGSVLLGNGDGTFQTAVSYGSGGFEAESVVVGDVNGDGKLDLLVANDCADDTCLNGNVSVLLGNGDGSFQGAVSYESVGQYALSMALGDVNGDGKLDLFVANQCVSGNSCARGVVGVLLGNGDGTFQTAVGYDPGGEYAASVAVGDVNGDGRPDLLVANYCADANCLNGGVSVLLGNGDGTFQAALGFGSGGGTAVSVAAADVNGDGKLDLLVANYCGADINCQQNGNVGVLLGNGNGTFQASVSYGSGGYGADSVGISDVNGDGKLDLLVVNQCSNSLLCGNGAGVVGVMLGNGNGTFQPAVRYGSGGNNASSLAVGDVNRDSKPDLLVANECVSCVNGVVGVLINTSTYTSTTSLMSSINPSAFGGPVTFTATVTSSGGTPTGTVTFMDGNTGLGEGTLSSGTTALKIATLTVGPHSITAVYGGDGANQGSTSAPLVQIVTQAQTRMTASSVPNPSTHGQLVTFTATLTSNGGVPNGKVTFSFGRRQVSVNIKAGKAVFSTAALPKGKDKVNATYTGNADYSAASASVTQQVN